MNEANKVAILSTASVGTFFLIILFYCLSEVTDLGNKCGRLKHSIQNFLFRLLKYRNQRKHLRALEAANERLREETRLALWHIDVLYKERSNKPEPLKVGDRVRIYGNVYDGYFGYSPGTETEGLKGVVTEADGPNFIYVKIEGIRGEQQVHSKQCRRLKPANASKGGAV